MRTALVALLAGAFAMFGMTAPAHADSLQDAKVAIAAGDGDAGARIIRVNGYASKPRVLADIIYGAGVLAVQADNGDAYSMAVAESFVEGGVTHATAQVAFVHAATLVAVNAPGDEQLLAELGPGGAAVLRTELAYLNVYLPPLGFL